MMKTVADALSTFYEAALDHEQATDLSRVTRLRSMTEFLKLSVLDMVEITPAILTTYNRLYNSAEIYSSSTQTDRVQRAGRFNAFKLSLRAFAEAVDAAKPSEDQMLLGTLNVNQVRNPLAEIV